MNIENLLKIIKNDGQFSSNTLVLLLSGNSTNKHVNFADERLETWEVTELHRLIRKGLLDTDSLTRKRSLYILKLMISKFLADMLIKEEKNNAESNSNEVIELKRSNDVGKRGKHTEKLPKGSTKTDSQAENFGILLKRHNLSDYWGAYVLLLETLEEFAFHLTEDAWPSQIKLLVPFAAQNKTQNQTVVIEGISIETSSFTVDFSWMAVIWTKGLEHSNPQVRKMVLSSLLEFSDYSSQLVPSEFVLGPLLKAINDPVHHKDFGVKGEYTSETGLLISQFFSQFSSKFSLSERISFVSDLSHFSVAMAPCRSGLMTIGMAIEASTIESTIESTEKISRDSVVHLVDRLRHILESTKRHFNPKYREKLYGHVFLALKNLTKFSQIGVESVALLFSVVPESLLKPTGSLYKMLKPWLVESNGQLKVSSGGSSGSFLVSGLSKMLENLFYPTSLGENNGENKELISEDQLGLWKNELYRWAKFFSLVFPLKLEMAEISSNLEKIFSEIWSDPETTKIQEKLKSLILASSLLEVSSIFPKESSKSGLLAPIISHYEKMVSFAEEASVVFWNSEKVNFDSKESLPGQIKGQLGGPTQRRLPPSLASAALKGILSTQVVSQIFMYLWKVHPNDNRNSLIRTSDFFWIFSKSLLAFTQSPPQKLSEFESELKVAALEGFVAISQSISATCTKESTVESSELIDLTSEWKSRVEDLTLGSTIFVSKVIVDGKLARSRKSSFECNMWMVLNNFISTHGFNTPLRKDILKKVFWDAVESLERVGEEHILPLLQCLRSMLPLGALSLAATEFPGDKTSAEVQVMEKVVKSGWSAMVDNNKRKVAPIAAFLSTMVHPSVFPISQMHQKDDGSQGPLKWLLGRLLEQGSFSPRTMRLSAMHWSGLWLSHPQITKLFYLDELRLLSLHGADEELDGEIMESDVAAGEYARLARTRDSEVAEIFKNTEMYPRICVALTMHHLNLISEKFKSSTVKQEEQLAEDAGECGRALLLSLLNSAAKDKSLGKELYKKKSLIHRRKVRVWQMLCILSPFINESMLAQICPLVTQVLDRNNMPSVRQYIEVFSAQIHLKFSHLIESNLLPLLNQHNMKPQAMSSYVIISTYLILNSAPHSEQIRTLETLFPAILPNITTHHHALRGFSQVLLHHVMSKFPEFNLALSPSNKSETDEASSVFDSQCLRAIYNFLETNHDCARLRSSVQDYLNAFDPISCCHPYGMFVEGLSKVEDLDFECVPTSVYDHVCTFLQTAREALRDSMASDAATLGFQKIEGKSEQIVVEKIEDLELQGSSSDFQRKVQGSREELLTKSFHEDLAILELDDLEEEEILGKSISRSLQLAEAQGERQGLIIVASLIGRIPNLAGLARTCEVFKASALAMADLSIMNDKQFQLISVTAERWIPLVEVPESNLISYLERQKTEGYDLVGLEQTANSIQIHEFNFQEKTVLVLGREKEGIPVEIIQILDACIEIPQLGLIRSLNVHVSGAIATWEYTRQNLEKSNKLV